MNHCAEIFQLLPRWDFIDSRKELSTEKKAKEKYTYPTSVKDHSVVFSDWKKMKK